MKSQNPWRSLAILLKTINSSFLLSLLAARYKLDKRLNTSNIMSGISNLSRLFMGFAQTPKLANAEMPNSERMKRVFISRSFSYCWWVCFVFNNLSYVSQSTYTYICKKKSLCRKIWAPWNLWKFDLWSSSKIPTYTWLIIKIFFRLKEPKQFPHIHITPFYLMHMKRTKAFTKVQTCKLH